MFKFLPILLVLVACTKKADLPEAVLLDGKTMGTTYSVKYYPAPTTPGREEMLREVEQTLLAVNREMSTYMPESEITRFNSLTTVDSWFKVSPGFHWVTKVALALAEKSQGIYDPTIAPLVNLWGFGPNKSKVVPTAEEIAKAQERVSYNKIIAHETEPMIRKTDVSVTLDLSSIAKGWGVDQVGRLLEERGVKSYMVEIGGEVRTMGGKPDESLWQIGISTPESDNINGIQKIIELKSQALATSGNYRNFFEKDGKRYAHILDPRTGMPAMSDIASVTVIDKNADCTQADGLATALLAMGSVAAKEFATNNNLTVYIISHIDDGEFTEWMTPDFKNFVKK